MKHKIKHICFIYPGYPPESHSGGIGTYIYEVSSALSRIGINVSVISRSDKFFDCTVRVNRYLTIYRLGEDVKAQDNKKLLFRFLGYESFYRKILNKVIEIDNEHEIDLIESCDWGAEGYLVNLEFKNRFILRCHTPSFISEKYNPQNQSYLSNGIKYKEKRLIEDAKILISPSRSLAAEVNKIIKVKRNFLIEHYLINEETIPKKTRFRLCSPIKLLSVGRIEKRKGQDIILRALEYLCNRGVNFKIDFIGADTPMKNNEKTSKYFLDKINPRIYSRINFCGEKPRKWILNNYRNYDLFIIASRFDNYPFVVLEAMASGLPVVGNNNSGIREQITPNRGLLFDGTAKGLLEKLLYIVDHDEFRECIGLNGKKWIKNNFSIKKKAKLLLNNYSHYV